MDFKQLTTFLTLSRIKNFTKTAENLGYVQSSVTSQIQRLETELGIKLFDRIGKRVILTDEGKKLIPYATKIVSLSSDMKNVVSPNNLTNGSITIGAAESLCLYRLPIIIKEYKKRYEDVDIYLKLLSCADFIPQLLENTIDIAFTIGDRIENDVVTTTLELPEKILVLAYPAHPLALQPNISAQALDNEPVILTKTGCCYRSAFEQALKNFHIKPKIIMETDSIQVIKQVAKCGLGICILPEIAVKEEIASKQLIPLVFENNYGMVSQLIHHKDKWISPPLDGFIEIAKRHWK